MSFASETEVQVLENQGNTALCRAEFHTGWEQGRGAYGGLVLGTLFRGCDAILPTATRARARLRSMTGEIFAPVLAEEMRIHTEILRAGNNVTTVQARIVQRGEAKASAVCVFGAARPRELDQQRILPPSFEPPADALHDLPVKPPMGPNFGQNLQFRAQDGLPFTGQKHASTRAWVRFVDASDWQTAHLIGLSDATWPTLYAEVSMPRPMATITFMMELFRDAPDLNPTEFLLHVGKTLAVSDGYLAEQRELWSASGELVALSHQTIAVIQ